MLSRRSTGVAVAAMAVLFSAAFNNDALAAWAPGDLITYPQSFWSSDPTATGLLLNNFGSVYSSSLGIVEAGLPGATGLSIQFAAAQFVMDYLPAFGTAGPLNFDLMNPTSTSSGRFGGEVLALRINSDFSDAGLLSGTLGIPFGDLQLKSFFDSQFNLNGLTVRQFLGQANNLLGGGSSFFYSIPELTPVAAELNSSFGAGGVSQWAQDHLRVVYLPGDFQEDGDVDGADLAQWKAGFGMSVGATHLQGDANADGDVDGADFLTWQRQHGNGLAVPETAAVPEPISICLLFAAMCFLSAASRTIGLVRSDGGSLPPFSQHTC